MPVPSNQRVLSAQPSCFFHPDDVAPIVALSILVAPRFWPRTAEHPRSNPGRAREQPVSVRAKHTMILHKVGAVAARAREGGSVSRRRRHVALSGACPVRRRALLAEPLVSPRLPPSRCARRRWAPTLGSTTWSGRSRPEKTPGRAKKEGHLPNSDAMQPPPISPVGQHVRGRKRARKMVSNTETLGSFRAFGRSRRGCVPACRNACRRNSCPR